MIELKRNKLLISFPEVHRDARCRIEFQRTLRIPDDGNDYPLPPGLGTFPLRHLDDYSSRLPTNWLERGGVIAPMHQSEALWINFNSKYPFAIKVATGKICAITGENWVNHLNRDPQDYVVLPDQPWLDGCSVKNGLVRQFVAMPLGKGYTVEEQLTGDAVHGGLQLIAYPMKAEQYNRLSRNRPVGDIPIQCCLQLANNYCLDMPMGIAPGGRMKQEIYDDEHPFEVWDQRHASRCFVSLLNSAQWMAVTGERPPTMPPTARDYAAHGLPWFDYCGGDQKVLEGSKILDNLKSVAEHANSKSEHLEDNETVDPRHIVHLGKPRKVRESTLN